MKHLLYAVGIGLTLSTLLGGTPAADDDEPGTGSQAARATWETRCQHFAEAAGTDAAMVLDSTSGIDETLVQHVSHNLADLDSAEFVDPARWFDDGPKALLGVQHSVPVTDFTGTEGVMARRGATAPASDAGVQAGYGGFVAENGRDIEGKAELIGLVVAAVVLFQVPGSFVCAGIASSAQRFEWVRRCTEPCSDEKAAVKQALTAAACQG